MAIDPVARGREQAMYRAGREDAQQWRPIISAPRDGTSILIAGGTVEYDASMGAAYPFKGVTIAWWDRDGWNGGYGEEYNGEYWHEPSHWMPLPPAPEGGAHAPPDPKAVADPRVLRTP